MAVRPDIIIETGTERGGSAVFTPAGQPGELPNVEDTNVNSHPVEPGFGPGPTEAIETFLSENDAFFVDTDMEKLHLTFNRGGFLKRRGRAARDATARLGRGLVADGPP